MARRRTKAAKQAQALLVWLESLELPTRVLGALRRDLEVITGEREGEEGSGVLAGFDQARFTEELYQKRGGQVSKVPTVAKGAIDALRAAILAPVSGDSIEAAQPAQLTDATSEGDEAVQPAQGDEAPADSAIEGIEAGQAAKPEVADAALAPADAQEEAPADVASETTPEPTAASAAPKRRGRPPRAAAAAEAAIEPVEAPAAPAKRRGRPPRSEAASEAAAGLPKRTRRARVTAALDAALRAPAPTTPPAEAPALAPAVPVVPAADPSFAKLLQLWHELHPQGQRAAMHYMASLVAEG